MPIDPRNLPRRFLRRTEGAVAVIVGLMLVVLMAFLAVGIDIASLYSQQRGLQARADLAAVGGALHLPDADTAAMTTVTGNGLAAEDMTALSYGTYVANSAIARSARLTAGSKGDTGINAVSVTLQDAVPLYFGQVITGHDTVTLTASATASRYRAAAFTLGSRLLAADLNAGVLNPILSGALGSSVSLSLLDYQNLANAQVDLLSFSKALNTRIGLQADDYTDLLKSNVGYGAVVGALLDTVQLSSAQGPLTTLLNAAGSSTLGASQLITPQSDAIAAQIEDVLPEIDVSALDILYAAADIVNANSQVSLGLDGSIPGITSVTTKLKVGEHPVTVVGDVGASAHTAQTRLLVQLGLSDSILSLGGTLLPANINLPVYVEIAGATAQLTDLNCNANADSDTIASFDTGLDGLTGTDGTHLVGLYIGSFSTTVFDNTTTPLASSALDYAPLLDIKLGSLTVASVQIKSYADVGASLQQTTSFTKADLDNQTVKTIGSGSLLNSTVSSLLSKIQIKIVTVPGLSAAVSLIVTPILNGLLSSLPTTLATSLLTPLDTVLDTLLKSLGIGVGQADLTLKAVQCSPAKLIR